MQSVTGAASFPAPLRANAWSTGKSGATDDDDDFDDFDNFSDDEDEQLVDPLDTGTIPVTDEGKQRRERVQELVMTEQEYIRDLEVLLQVVNAISSPSPSSSSLNSLSSPSSSWGENAGGLIRPLLGNIVQVLNVAKRFLEQLQQAQKAADEDMLVGRVFLDFSGELCDVYKVYCSNYNVEVIPSIKKLEGDEETHKVLVAVAEELRRHKNHLLDLNSVLIKPVQRVLKYPLYLHELVRGTPPHHRDLDDLGAAMTCITASARVINEYTRVIDVVHKYRCESDHSLHGRMKRVNFHSKKKRNRMSAYMSQKLGIVSQVSSSVWVSTEGEFWSVSRGAEALMVHVRALQEAVRARHTAELMIADALMYMMPQRIDVARLRETALDAYNRLLHQFSREVETRVMLPVAELVQLCEPPQKLIEKRQDKLLDLEAAQGRLATTKDPIKAVMVEEEVAVVRETYEALEKQLIEELPVLTSHAREVLTLATRAIAAARLYFQGHLAHIYLHLAMVCGLSHLSLEEGRVQCRQQVDSLKDMLPLDPSKKPSTKESRTNKLLDTTKMAAVLLSSRGSTDVLPKSLQRPVEALKHSATADYIKNLKSLSRSHSRRSAPPSTSLSSNSPSHVDQEGKQDHRRRSAPGEYMRRLPSLSRSKRSSSSKIALKHKQKEILKKYPREDVFELSIQHQGGSDNELTLLAGAVVAVLQKKDPMGGEERWVVDDGNKIGLVKASFLKLYTGTDELHEDKKGEKEEEEEEEEEEQGEEEEGVRISSLKIGSSTQHHYQQPHFPCNVSSATSSSNYESSITSSPSFCSSTKSSSCNSSNMKSSPSFRHIRRSSPCRHPSISKPQLSLPPTLNYTRPEPQLGQQQNSKSGMNQYSNSEMIQCLNSQPNQYSNSQGNLSSISSFTSSESLTAIYDKAEYGCNPIATHRSLDERLYDTPEGTGYSEQRIYDVVENMKPQECISSRFTSAMTSPLEASDSQLYYAVYGFASGDASQLDLLEGQQVILVEGTAEDWWYVKNLEGRLGYVPASYLLPLRPAVCTRL